MKKMLIDGHNLIPKMPGMQLRDADDETRLVEVLREYCRLARRQAELFFDGAPQPERGLKKSGLVRVHFVRVGLTADAAIIDWLRTKGKEARNFSVVSSDRRVQAEARGLGAQVISSEEFVLEVQKVFNSPARIQEIREKPLSSQEIDEWMTLFGKGKNS